MRLRIVLVCCAALALTVAVATATAKTPKADSAFGSGVRAPSCSGGCPSGEFSFNATSGPNGENASGTFNVDFLDYAAFTAGVSCLHVSGNTATLVGQITRGTGAADAAGGDPFYFVAVVTDNGKITPKAPSPDQMSFVSWDTEAGWLTSGFTLAQVCSNPIGALGASDMFGLVSGDLTVIDK